MTHFNRDFDAPGPLMADTSASTITAAGLLLLAKMELSLSPPNDSGAAYWRQEAVTLLNAAVKLAWKPSWQSLLSNGTVNNPASNNLTGTIYGASNGRGRRHIAYHSPAGDYNFIKV